MRRRMVRRGTAAVVALVLSAAGAIGAVPAGAEEADAAEATPFPVPGMAVSLAQAGEVEVWGPPNSSWSTVPASLAGVAVSQVVFPFQAGLALTADGRVVGWGSNQDRLEQVPAEVAASKVAQIATNYGYAGAVTRDGRVMTWGKKRPWANPLNVPAGLGGVKQLAIAEYSAAALKDDGSVVAWGTPDHGQTTPPAGLKATAITALATGYLALTEQGTVVHWGGHLSGGVPAELQVPGSVKAIASSAMGALALRADDTLVPLGQILIPDEIADVDPVLLAGMGHEYAVVDSDRKIHYWSDPKDLWPGEVPEELNGRDIAQIALGSGEGPPTAAHITGGVVITKMLRAELPQVTGAVRVGSVLTGVPGTFSAEPDSIASQWLVGGVPVAGNGAQLTVTPAMVGQTIAYRSTASKAGETVSASSAGVVVPPPVVPPVPSATRIVKVKVAKKATKVTVAGKVTASKSPAGRATVTIKKGKKTIVTKTVGVSASGALTLTVKKFGKLAIKKTRSKSRTGYAGKYSVTIRYLGNKQVKASTRSGKFTVKR